jgi:hypothetical protein
LPASALLGASANLPKRSRMSQGVGMSAGKPLVTMRLGDREISVRRVALTPAALAKVLDETPSDILSRLKAGDLDSVPGRYWLVRVESAVAFAEAKVRAGLLGADALNRLATLIGTPGGMRRQRSSAPAGPAPPSPSGMPGKWDPPRGAPRRP